MSAWEMSTRASEMEAQAAAWLAEIFPDGEPRNAAGRFVSPEPSDATGNAPREVCPGCGRRVYVFELTDARLIPEHPGDYACGACRGTLERQGIVSRAEWAERYAAPPEMVAGLRAAVGG